MLLLVEEFIPESQRLELICEAYSATESDWGRKDDSDSDYWIGNRLTFESPIFTELDRKLSGYFSDYQAISPFCAVQRIPVGQSMGEHMDMYHESVAFGCVVYLNDNFGGGEIVYTKLGKSFKPVAGMMVIHAGDEPHRVETVSDSTRYMLTAFVYAKKGIKPRLMNDEA